MAYKHTLLTRANYNRGKCGLYHSIDSTCYHVYCGCIMYAEIKYSLCNLNCLSWSCYLFEVPVFAKCTTSDRVSAGMCTATEPRRQFKQPEGRTLEITDVVVRRGGIHRLLHNMTAVEVNHERLHVLHSPFPRPKVFQGHSFQPW